VADEHSKKPPGKFHRKKKRRHHRQDAETRFSESTGDEELDNGLKEAKDHFEEIVEMARKNYDLLDVSRKDSQAMLENPDNFSEQELQVVKAIHERLEEELFKGDAKSYRKKLKAPARGGKRGKKRKKRMIGPRKGWIQM